MYEKRLKNEFDLLLKLQSSEVKNIVEIYYKDRNGKNQQWKPIMTNPDGPLYPYSFKVTYHFPKMYVGPDKIIKNWSGTIMFNVPENILMQMESNMGVQIENGFFKDGEIPFNNHVSKTYICTGTAWNIAHQGYGIWYFIICVGCLLNMEKFIMDTQRVHLNKDALVFWKTKRGMQPTNKIKWPFDLNMRGGTKQSLIRFGHPQILSKPQISFGQKRTPSSRSQITFGKRN